MNELVVLSGRATPDLAGKVCEYLRIDQGEIHVSSFPDGETKIKVDEDVRGRDVFVIQSTCPPVNENLMELLIMIESLKRASAERITAVIPYFGYARQDRKDEGRVPITAKLVANLITRAGADRVLTMDLHAAQIQGFFDIPVDHLVASPILDDHIRRMGIPMDEIMVVSPDEGSIKRALAHAQSLECPMAIIDKRREGKKTTSANLIGGPVDGKVCLIFDDMISTAGSICGAAKMVHAAGARQVYLGCTHGVFCGDAIENLTSTPVERVITTDTIPLAEDRILPNLEVLTIAPLLGEAILRIHRNESVSNLFKEKRKWLVGL
jgi:ribose-phosphate pyrophosphokinase